jgi:hypothetical protein
MSNENDALPYVVWIQDRQGPNGPVGKNDPKTCRFDKLADAIEFAKDVIEQQLAADLKLNPDERPLMLLDGLLDFGFMPWIEGPDVNILDFDSRSWAEVRCYELTGWQTQDRGVYGPLVPTGRSVASNEGKPIKAYRLMYLRGEVLRLEVDEEYRAALLENIERYSKEILARPEYKPGEGWSDLEALQQLTLGNAMESYIRKLNEEDK